MEFIEQLKADATRHRQFDTAQLLQTDLVALVESYGAELYKDGADWHKGRQCPACNSSAIVIGKGKQGHPRFWCNTCTGRSGGSAIDFVEKAEKVDYTAALRILSSRKIQPRPAQPQQQEGTFSAAYWLGKLQEWRPALTPQSVVGQYLLGRGLQPETWAAFGLGACMCEVEGVNYPAVAIPWTVDGQLIGGRYRLALPKSESPTEPGNDKPIRFKWWRGSKASGYLYGDQTGVNHDVLILTEGELNDVSIWQECKDSVDVRSVGSENSTITPEIAERITKTWGHVLVWADKFKVAETWAAAIPGAIPLDTDGVDANQRLQDGDLRAQIAELLVGLGLREESAPATLPPVMPAVIEIGDLTDYVGQDIDAPTWAALQAECHRRYDGLWTMRADQTGQGYHVTGLHAKPLPLEYRGGNP
ncbi:hypothetical protein E6Q11_02705 [Candidatus Dojkabacteria bacterium]|uniref:Uncharacterized protein n=1 Tax=Candidatus Dojkabacteria bacterium TaxID=2099670 RepID=A0A5C7J7S0_9BACT|nr:MAG: hypothetical protein E6Q11_02705 [Candidatus Dojkabacteria bacterium]